MKNKLILIIILFANIGFAQEDINPNQLLPIEIERITTSETSSAFGNSISFSSNGTVLAVGESGYGTPTRVSSGRVRVYTNETGSWIQKGQDLIGIEDFFNTFGKKVELSSDGNTLAVYDSQINVQLNAGETFEDKYGDLAPQYFPYIQVYQFVNGTWSKIGADFLFNDLLDVVDITLSGDGKSIAIANKTGTKIYELNSDTWNQIGQEIPARDTIYDEKISLSEDGKTLIVGDSHYSESNNENPSWEGQIKVYQYVSNTWSQLGNAIKGAVALSLFGSEVSIAADGRTIAVLASQISNDDYIVVLKYTDGNWVSKGTHIQQKNAEIKSMQLSGDGNAIVIGETFTARVLKYNTDWEQVNAAVSSNNNADGFGKAVTISRNGEIYAVGAPNSSNGYVSIFNHNKNSATRFGNEIYGYGTQDKLGSSVAVSGNGNIIAVGANGASNSGGSNRYGHVRVFEKTASGLEQIGSDIRNTTDFISGDFGTEVSLNEDGTLLAISAPELNSSKGAVYVYQRRGNIWYPIGNIITDPKGDRTGSSIALSDDGSILAVGSGTNPRGVSASNYKGFTTVYKYNITNNTWETLGQQILGEAIRDYSGTSIDLSGDGSILAIGAYGNNGETASGGHGHVRIFKFNNNSWVQMGEDINGNPEFNINFGRVVTLSSDGKTLIVSDPYSQSRAGSIDLYNWITTTSEWEHEVKLKTFKSSGANNGHRFEYGWDTAISDDKRILLVGEYLSGKGVAHLYIKNKEGNWVENDLSLAATQATTKFFGANLSLSSNGNTLVVGATGDNRNGTNTGMAAVYHLNLCSSIESFEVFDGVETTAIEPSNNLIENGSAESLPLSENGWTTVSGVWSWPVRLVQSVPVKYGHKYFKANTVTSSELYQDVDVSSFSATIDAGSQYFYFSTYLQSFQVNGVEDDSQVIVEYRDNSGAILDSYDTGLSQITEGWTLFEDTKLAPVGTKTIRVRLKAINNNQFRVPAAFIDNVFLSTTVGPDAVSIIDVNFEQYLIDENIDSDGIVNGQVLKIDIANITELILNDKNISNLTGIEGFTSLVELNATNNQITNLDVSKNLNLEKLFFANNKLTSIDLSKNVNLKTIDLGENELTTIDVHLLTNLESLSCYKNQLTTINLLSNTKLISFIANENQLKYLDIRVNEDLAILNVSDNSLESLTLKNENNTKLITLDTRQNPNLTCIEVDDKSYSDTNWASKKDATASFSTNCAPSNDDCANAIPLTFGQETPGDINNGTSSNLTDCVEESVLADVWYKVTVPNSGEFSIQGIGSGGLLKFAIYDSCSSATAISCGENISLTNLTTDTVYYLRVWMEDQSLNKGLKSSSVTGTFTIKAQETSVLKIDNFLTKTNKITMYPNPASSFLNIAIKGSEFMNKITIYNVLGKKVLENKTILVREININIGKLNKGIYLVKIQGNRKEYLNKLIIK